ncbi:MAG TPA: VOC family protein [Acidimicrobiales bacterium]|jgi:catechol 2,3-dioxygenase-like lactoylglutathione lyase family enzyme
MATVLALDHIVLVNTDVEQTLAWYVRHAGLSPLNVDEWRAGKAFFPSLRVDEATILDFVPGDPKERGHLDHVCFVVSTADLAALTDDPELEIVDQGERSGARGLGQSIYVHDPDGLLVEFRSYPA